MNILVLNWRDLKHPKAGGAEIVTHEHAKRWVQAGHQVTWISSGFHRGKPKEIIDGIRIVRIFGLPVYLGAALYYTRNRKSFDFIVDEAHGLPFFTCLYVDKPKVLFIHEIAGNIWDAMYPFPINYLGKSFEKIILGLYKNVTCWTDAPSTMTELASYGIAKQHCIAIPCPITNAALAVLPKKTGVFTCMSVGRLVPMKRVEDSILSFSFLCKKGHDARLWIVGGGSKAYTSKLRSLVEDLDVSSRVKFWGRVSEKKKIDLMRQAHVLMHTSIKEGWGLVVLEAASQGTPSVVYDVPGLRDTVRHNETGIVVKINNPSNMTEEIDKLIQNQPLYAKLQTEGLVWSKSFTWKNAANQSLGLIERIYTRGAIRKN